MQELTHNEKASTFVGKVNANFAELANGVTLQTLSEDVKSGNFISKLNANFAALSDSDDIITLTDDADAGDFIRDLNANFDTVESQGGGVEPGDTTTVTVYDLSNTCAGGTKTYPADVRAGRQYVIRKDRVRAADKDTTYMIVRTCDDNKATIETWMNLQSGTYQSGSKQFDQAFTAGADAPNFRISCYSSGLWNGDYCSIEHTEEWTAEQIAAMPLNGKKWLVLGDSISTESSTYASTGYGKITAAQFNLREYNVTHSGWQTHQFLDGTAYASSLSSSNKIDITLFRTDIDIVSVMLGTNDEGFSAGSSVYIERIEALYNRIMGHWPNAKVVFLTPIKRYNYPGLASYVTALQDFCATHVPEIPCIDLYHDYDAENYPDIPQDMPAIDPDSAVDPFPNEGDGSVTVTSAETYREKYFCPIKYNSNNVMTDNGGTHPNDLGHRLFVAPRVLAWFEANKNNL